ncbi:hypothetical protein MTR_3g049870 [Medicago truncatula]|uniref:Aspartyl-tRNA synthetase n=1 Tax=Medicago truncatula TaxID=3880 RepID=G7J1C1_MEDTR|nr:hypothetical protein MTR_3g049870 [Medicago truncatula]
MAKAQSELGSISNLNSTQGGPIPWTRPKSQWIAVQTLNFDLPVQIHDVMTTSRSIQVSFEDNCQGEGYKFFYARIDEELWDILEDGVDLVLDEEGLYKKHHKIGGILVVALPHKECLKMSDKSTAKVMFASLCSNYEGNKKIKEYKATMLVQFQILKKRYVAADHLKKILRSLPAKWRPKVAAIEEARDLNVERKKITRGNKRKQEGELGVEDIGAKVQSKLGFVKLDGRIWVKGDQNRGVWVKRVWVHERKPKNWVLFSGADRLAS